jgi:hypothetical protein
LFCIERNIGLIRPLGWPIMNARGGGKCAPWATGHSGQSGLTDAVDVPASIVLAAHLTRLDPVYLP